MKHTVLSILVLTTLFSSILYAETCNKDMYSITGAISGKFNGKEVSLFLISGDSLLPLSVDTIQNATFSFKGNEYLNNVAKVTLNDPEQDYSCEVFLEKGNIQVTLDSVSHAKGTHLNDLYAAYQSEYRLRVSVAEKEYATNIQGKDDPKTERFESLQKERFAYISKFQTDNINNAVGKYLYVKDIGRFWDPSFWETYERLPSDIKSHPKVQNYCMRRREMDEMKLAMEKQIGGKILNQEFSFSMIPHGILLNHEGVIIANKLWNVSLKKKLMEIYGE